MIQTWNFPGFESKKKKNVVGARNLEDIMSDDKCRTEASMLNLSQHKRVIRVQAAN